MQCCGHQGQVIDLRGGDAPLRMVRCATCGHREWQVAGEVVPADDAFTLLGQAYRAVPRQARAVRDRAASQTAARAAVRAARAEAARPASPARRGVDRDGLAALLQGWTVLGATG